MKKVKFNWKKIVVVVVIIVLAVFCAFMYLKLTELTNQLTYLQDSTNVILSDVGNLQSNIEKTLEEGASMVEDYSIDIVDMNFSKKTYDVSVSVIPKEYSDKTSVTLYFGTKECPLKADGYTFKGNMTLPLNQTFDGNITFLIANGSKKATEVLQDYNGMNTDLSRVLSGSLEDAPTYKDGEIHLKSDCTFALDNIDLYEFTEFEMVADLNDEEIWSQDLMPDLKDETANESVDDQLLTTEVDTQETSQSFATSGTGESTCKFSYELPVNTDGDDADGVREDQHIRIYLRAVTKDGYRFEYDVFQGDYLGDADELDGDSFDWDSHAAAYDRKENKLELNQE